MGLFDKKYCDICGEKIGLLGNRKLEDGNCCKTCAGKLSPWFSERRHSTVEGIRRQLAYREENREKAARFRVSREFGESWRVLLDDTNGWFTVTRGSDLEAANPDILEFSQLTGCRLDIDEHRTERKYTDKDGKQVSYVPPRYDYSYDFRVIATVRCPYFDEMRFALNRTPVEVEMGQNRSLTLQRSFDPACSREYRQYEQMGNDICAALEQARTGATQPEAAGSAGGTWVCPVCGGMNQGTFCEYCGAARPQTT